MAIKGVNSYREVKIAGRDACTGARQLKSQQGRSGVKDKAEITQVCACAP